MPPGGLGMETGKGEHRAPSRCEHFACIDDGWVRWVQYTNRETEAQGGDCPRAPTGCWPGQAQVRVLPCSAKKPSPFHTILAAPSSGRLSVPATLRPVSRAWCGRNGARALGVAGTGLDIGTLPAQNGLQLTFRPELPADQARSRTRDPQSTCPRNVTPSTEDPAGGALHVGGVAGHVASSLCKQLRVSSWIGGPCAHRECPSTGTAEEADTGRRPGGDRGRPAQCGREPRTPGATADKRQGGPARASEGPHAGLARASCLHTVCGALSHRPGP